jgi:16S rRNA (guanine(966)-N(2))-methyltransferase RsmD
MRVIGGEFRSRRLKTLPGMETRPTPDRLREALFNVLSPSIAGSVFLDAYAGTGAVGIEALSRGASRAIFIERSRGAAALIRENLSSLELAGRAAVLQGRVLQHLARQAADVVFLDPPYPLEREYAAALEILGSGSTPRVVVQHAARFSLAERYGNLQKTRVLKQGDNALSFYSLTVEPTEEEN